MTILFFFKQKTAYEMRISDWSSDVCSSDLDTEQGADQLRHERDATNTAQSLAAENANRQATPGSAQAMQGPDAQHIVNLPFILRQFIHAHKNESGNRTGD